MKLKMDRNRPLLFLKAAAKEGREHSISPLELVPGLWRGFSPTQVRYHNLTRSSMPDYFPDRDRYLITINTNRYVWPILHDKLAFDAFMRGRLPITEAVCAFVRGDVLPVESGFDIARLVKTLQAGTAYVVKPVQGGKGVGVRTLHMNNDHELLFGTNRVPVEDAHRLWELLNYHLVVPFVRQHETLRAVFPHATNTLRITAFKPRGHPAKLFAPVLRVGTQRSAPMDNFSQGGLIGLVDDRTGEVVRACERTSDLRRKDLHSHPDTGQPLVGLKIPFWNDISQAILAFHERLPAFDLVGWDVLVGEQEWHVIEGNHNPDLNLPFSFTTRRAHPAFDGFLRSLDSSSGKLLGKPDSTHL